MFFVANLVLCAPLLSGSARAAAPPNILVILVDDLGYGDLSSYGAKDLSTPHVDRLIASGLRFNNFYANCPVCSPTRASLLTGRYPELVGVPGVIRTHAENNWGKLAPSATLLPEMLKQSGYHTAIVGKWHLGLTAEDTPNARGFDHFHGFLGDMMDDYYKHRRHGINYMRLNADEIDPPGHATDLFSQWACDYLRERAGTQPASDENASSSSTNKANNKPKEQPFFLYLAYNAPHTPIQPPKDWLQKVRDRSPEMSLPRARLVALIEHMDAGIGKVMQCLHDTGLAEDTLVVFTSDNGGQLNVGANNGGLRDGKQSMYEGGLKVPASISWPGQIAAGRLNHSVCLTMDLFPTLCDVAGVPVRHRIEGVSLRPLWLDENAKPADRDVFFHRREGGNRYGGLTIQAVRRGNWKLLQNSPFAPLELYDLKSDPTEETNLADVQKKIFNELSKSLRRQIQRGGGVPWQAIAP